MTALEIISAHSRSPMADTVGQEIANCLRIMADKVLTARTKDGAPLRDVSDFRAWLRELADEAERFPAKKLPESSHTSGKRRRLA